MNKWMNECEEAKNEHQTGQPIFVNMRMKRLRFCILHNYWPPMSGHLKNFEIY